MSTNVNMGIVASALEIGRKSATSITAGIGDQHRSEGSKKIVLAVCLAPSIYQSAGENLTGGITKQCSKDSVGAWFRRLVLLRRLGSKLTRYYLRSKAKKRNETSIMASARKMLGIVHYLLVNGEGYVVEDFEKRLQVWEDCSV